MISKIGLLPCNCVTQYYIEHATASDSSNFPHKLYGSYNARLYNSYNVLLPAS